MSPGAWQQERSGLWSLRSKRQLLPIADLNADGDAVDWLTIPHDITPTLSLLVGDDGTVTHTIKTDATGQSLIAAKPALTAGPTAKIPVGSGLAPLVIWNPQVLTASGSTASFDVSTGVNVYYSAVITAVSGTTPVLSLFIDYMLIDGAHAVAGNTIFNGLSTAATLTGDVYSGTSSSVNLLSVRTASARLRWTVTGTNPSFTILLAAYSS